MEPQIQAYYKHSKVKQYFKEGRALRTETTVNDPYDFGIGRLLKADELEGVVSTLGHEINERLLDAELEACDCAPDSHDAKARWCRRQSKTARKRPRCASAIRG